MSRIRKRFERLLNNPKESKWDELRTILEFFGLVCEPPDGGSHWTVFHPDLEDNVTVPVHNNRVKVVYVKKLIKLIEDREEE
ncbi:MAG: type II toxin-antitoxin system HicA family toxin [Carboxydocellales bacterium]